MPLAASEVLAALRSKASAQGFRIAIVSGEGPLTEAALASLIEINKAGPVATAHLPQGPDGGAAALSSLKNSTGVPFGDTLLFAADPALIRSGNRCGATTVVTGPLGVDADCFRDGIAKFADAQLDQRGF